jgi:REP element-mobilizing transposase RayT
MLKAYYRRNLPHIQKGYTAHFLTFCTFRRWILPDWARQITLECCLREHEHAIDLHIAVVMPDHVHLVFTPLVDVEHREVFSLARITQAIKSASSHAINRRARVGRVWQIESFDHVIRSSESMGDKIAYVLANPLRRGLVDRAEDWPWQWMPAGDHQFSPPKLV